jgi:hypothetical protein
MVTAIALTGMTGVKAIGESSLISIDAKDTNEKPQTNKK